jgi:hypothetical protein
MHDAPFGQRMDWQHLHRLENAKVRIHGSTAYPLIEPVGCESPLGEKERHP